MDKFNLETNTLLSIIQRAVRAGVKGTWSGSSYRYHPSGLLRNGILFVDEHNTHNYSQISIAENPDAQWTRPGNHSCSEGDPKPRPIDCRIIDVYWTGTWRKEGPWQPKIMAELELIRKETEEREIEIKKAERKKKAKELWAKRKEEQELKAKWK